MNSYSKILATLGLSLLFSACGASDLYTVTLTTGFENLNPTPNLLKGLALQMVAVDPVCFQPNLLAGVKIGPENLDLASRRIGMVVSNGSGQHQNPINASWLGTNSAFPPIEFKVPAGVLEFGVIGAIVQPSPSAIDPNGDCATMTGGSINSTYSVLGHRKIEINQSTNVGLNVWINPVTQAPSTTPSVAGYDCTATMGNGGTAEDETLHQICANKNFKAMLCIGEGGTNCNTNLVAEYVFSKLNAEFATQLVNSSGSAAAFYFPDIDPVRFFPVNSSGVKYGFPAVFGENKIGNANQMAIPFGYVSLAHNGMIPVVLTQQTTGINDVTINFAAIPGHSTYDLQIADGFHAPGSGTPSFNPIATAQSAGSYNASNITTPTILVGNVYTISVSPNSVANQSTWTYYKPVDMISSASFTATPSSGQVTVTFTSSGTTPPTGAVLIELQLTSGGVNWNSPPQEIAAGSTSWTFSVPSATYTSGKVRVFNHIGGTSSATWSGSISP